MSTYTDHDGRQWTINQTVSELSQDLYADLLQAMTLALHLQAERDQLIRWQAEAIEVLKRWDQVADLVPGSFLVLDATRSACVHAYIDHLQAENRAMRQKIDDPWDEG